MKNSEIHGGLKQKDIRDFLSRSLRNFMERLIDNSKNVVIPYTDEPYVYAIQKAEQDIKSLTEQIEIYKGIQASLRLIKMNGWDEFDVSDETEKDKGTKLKMAFIGTQEEYEQLLETIKNEE